jgi:hypothetical protein
MSGSGHQVHGEFGVYPPRSFLIRVSQGITGYRLASKSHVVQAMIVCPEGLLNSTQTFAERKLGKSHRQELISARKAFAVAVATVLRDTGIESVTWQKVHYLRKDDSTFVHGDS